MKEFGPNKMKVIGQTRIKVFSQIELKKPKQLEKEISKRRLARGRSLCVHTIVIQAMIHFTDGRRTKNKNQEVSLEVTVLMNHLLLSVVRDDQFARRARDAVMMLKQSETASRRHHRRHEVSHELTDVTATGHDGSLRKQQLSPSVTKHIYSVMVNTQTKNNVFFL